jgi:hypothetical protein
MKHQIIGRGEIGQGLFSILAYAEGETSMSGREDTSPKECDILHITFPFSDDFISEVKRYQELYKPKYTIIHSTVPRGTSRQCGAIHSPCICQHPFIEEGLRTFPKMLGGEQSSEVADYFRRAGMKVVLFDAPETTEVAKLFLTEYYRHCIEFTQRVKRYCDEHELNFSEVYRIPNNLYNQGYLKLGFPEYVHPILEPIMGEIGGHCVVPNSKLIKKNDEDYMRNS